MGITAIKKMKRVVALMFLLVFVFAFSPQKANAQFWKKWFEKDQKRKSRPRSKTYHYNNNAVEATKTVKKKDIEYPPTKLKSRYRIDILILLYLDELVTGNTVTFKENIPEKALPGVGFYQGVKLAADTLSSLGYHVDIFIHDITQKDFSPQALLKSNVLNQSDLIIGALQSYQISGIAAFAKKAKINFISAFSPSDGDINNNPFFTLIQPTLSTHCKRILDKAYQTYPHREPLLFYRTSNSVDSLAYSYVIADHEDNFQKISWNKNLQKSQLVRFVDSSKVNLIVMPIIDVNYTDNILLELNSWFPHYQFEVYGMPSWKSLNSLRKPNAYPNIGVNYTSPFYYDLSMPTYQSVSNNFKKQFKGRPIEMVFRGYETLLFYAFLLQKYGTVFNDKLSKNIDPAFSNYDIKPIFNNHGLLYNENQHLFFYRYQNGNFMVNQ